MPFLDLNIGLLPPYGLRSYQHTLSARGHREGARCGSEEEKRRKEAVIASDQPAVAAFALVQNVATSVATSPPPPMRWSMFHHSVRAVAQPEVTW